ITGTLTVDGTVIAVTLDRPVTPPKGTAVAQKGQYTMVMDHPADTNAPQGDGYGAVTVDRTGAVTCVGKLGDGTPYSQSAQLNQAGEWPFHAVPKRYGNQGVIAGKLTIHGEAAAPNAIEGTLAWFKEPRPDD